MGFQAFDADGKLKTTATGGSGAPTDATYITQTAHASLTAEQVLGALATGLMRSTTATGVVNTITSSIVGQVLTVTGATHQELDMYEDRRKFSNS